MNQSTDPTAQPTLHGHIVDSLKEEALWANAKLPKLLKSASARPLGPVRVLTKAQAKTLPLGSGNRYKLLNPIEGVLMAFLLHSSPALKASALLAQSEVATEEQEQEVRPRWDVAMCVRLASTLVLPLPLIQAGLLLGLAGDTRTLREKFNGQPEEKGTEAAFSLTPVLKTPFQSLTSYCAWDSVMTVPSLSRRCALPLLNKGNFDNVGGDLTHAILGACCIAVPRRKNPRSIRAHVALLTGACIAGSADVLALELDMFPQHDIAEHVGRATVGRNLTKADPTTAALASLSCLKVLQAKKPDLLRRPDIPGALTLAHAAIQVGNSETLRYLFEGEPSKTLRSPFEEKEDDEGPPLEEPLVTKAHVLKLEEENPALTTVVWRAVNSGNVEAFTYLVNEAGFQPTADMLRLVSEDSALRPKLLAALERQGIEVKTQTDKTEEKLPWNKWSSLHRETRKTERAEASLKKPTPE